MERHYIEVDSYRAGLLEKQITQSACGFGDLCGLQRALVDLAEQKLAMGADAVGTAVVSCVLGVAQSETRVERKVALDGLQGVSKALEGILDLLVLLLTISVRNTCHVNTHTSLPLFQVRPLPLRHE